MRALFVVLLFASVAWAHEGKVVTNLRESCVAFERTQISRDANDLSHLKSTDWADASFCQGFIMGFELGANHTTYVLKTPRRLEIFTSQHTVRQIAKAIVEYIDDHPEEDDVRNLLLGALQKEGAAVFFDVGPPDCPKDMKTLPSGGCIVRSK